VLLILVPKRIAAHRSEAFRKRVGNRELSIHTLLLGSWWFIAVMEVTQPRDSPPSPCASSNFSVTRRGLYVWLNDAQGSLWAVYSVVMPTCGKSLGVIVPILSR